MENSEHIEEDPFELAASSLFVFLDKFTKASNMGSIGDISQKTLILNDMLRFLQDDPGDTESYTSIIELAVEARFIINKANEESMNCLYDRFIDCVANALPENLSEDFRKSFKKL